MEILRFDSSAPEGKYRPWIRRITAQLLGVPVVCANAAADWTAESGASRRYLSASCPAQNHVAA